jgi:hypothetical protein
MATSHHHHHKYHNHHHHLLLITSDFRADLFEPQAVNGRGPWDANGCRNLDLDGLDGSLAPSRLCGFENR